MNTRTMEDVPREVLDEVYKKWSNRLETGWSQSMWCGCSLCTWMANELGVGRMGEVDCELCPLWDGEWCRSLPEESKINPDYKLCTEIDIEGWEDRVKEFLEFIRPYCSSDYLDLTDEEDKSMDKEKAKVAILELRKAIKAVRECGADSECWIVKDLSFHIEELQNEILCNERQINEV